MRWSYKLFVGILMSCLLAASQAQEVNSFWRLRVMDSQHRMKVDATIRFTAETAESCMGGTWKRIVVEAETAHEAALFPLAEPLAYELERGVLTIGRTAVCDGYLFLTGKSEAGDISGKYDAVNIGSSKTLGYFSLKEFH